LFWSRLAIRFIKGNNAPENAFGKAMSSFKIIVMCIYFTLLQLSDVMASVPDSLILHSFFAVKSERMVFKQELISETIEANVKLALNPENEYKWVSAFWGMELIGYRSLATRQALFQALSTFPSTFSSLQRAALEAAYALYDKEFGAEIKIVADSTRFAKLFAMSAIYLLRLDGSKKNRDILSTLMQARFFNWQDDPILRSLSMELREPQNDHIRLRPSLVDLFHHFAGSGVIVIYSIQRHNRDYPGLTIIQKPDGTFLRNPDGSLFHIAHLARSMSALPGYLTNGNSPQGILSIQGIEKVDSDFIGPTPVLSLVLPHEVTVTSFFHNESIQDTTWTIEKYLRLLPRSWREYYPLHEAFYAGKAGRTEIIAHGTAVDPEYYRGKQYYPYTPSLGCLTALELWSSQDGSRLVSDQQALIHAYQSAGGKGGYFIIVDKDNKSAPVALQEILIDLLNAEGTF
jgi:hypothetical protein